MARVSYLLNGGQHCLIHRCNHFLVFAILSLPMRRLNSGLKIAIAGSHGHLSNLQEMPCSKETSRDAFRFWKTWSIATVWNLDSMLMAGTFSGNSVSSQLKRTPMTY